MNELLKKLKEKAHEIGGTVQGPRFYTERSDEIKKARNCAERSGTVGMAKKMIREKGDVMGHGVSHADKVALETGAIIYCEAGSGENGDKLAENGMIAGYLHDICRDQRNHPEKGAQLVEDLLADLIDKEDLGMITFAIKNHEAFKKFEQIDDDDYMLVSNALYDADKFRWGPDNFLYTLWDMAEGMNIPLDTLISSYERGLNGIERIKGTFRTPTGRIYGPDFIDRGLEIGKILYNYCLEITNRE